MPGLAAGFQSLPDEYQTIIRLAQDRHRIAMTLERAIDGALND